MRCGGPAPRSYTSLWLWLGVPAVALIVVLGIVGSPAKPPERNRAATPAPVAAPREQPVVAPAPPAPAPEPPPAVTVTAEQLRKDYEANEVSADDRYRKQALLVTGRVDSIKKDFSDHPYVVLATSNRFEGVHARFARGTAEAALGTLSRGDKVTLRCIGDNVMMGSPQLKGCILQ